MSDRLLRLVDSLLRLEDSLLRLADRLVDNPIFQLSASLYLVYIQRVMQKLENIADSFTYSVVICISHSLLLLDLCMKPSFAIFRNICFVFMN